MIGKLLDTQMECEPPIDVQIESLLSDLPHAFDFQHYHENCRPSDGDRYVVSRPNTLTEQPDSRPPGPPDESEVYDPQDVFEVPPDLDLREALHSLDPWQDGEFRRKFQASSTDALAWYVPFHYVGLQHGVYISSRGLIALLTACLRHGWAMPNGAGQALDDGFNALLRHEIFHFATECMATNFELLTGHACYLKASEALRQRDGGSYRETEEALANAYMLRGFRYPNRRHSGSGLFTPLRAFTQEMGPGYRDAELYVGARQYRHHASGLACDYLMESESRWGVFAINFASLYPSLTNIDWRRCPVMFVDEDGIFEQLGIFPKFIQALPRIVETASFDKMLRKMKDQRIERDWTRTKLHLKDSTQYKGLDFKPWPKAGDDYFSVRVNQEARAHLRIDRKLDTWFAEEIGRHDRMGH